MSSNVVVGNDMWWIAKGGIGEGVVVKKEINCIKKQRFLWWWDNDY